ncbi:MAG: hypothetical protein HC923_07375, partial [Myxococcales bacterium]|nr:hypothetical protein [Myxococcales bacterium]
MKGSPAVVLIESFVLECIGELEEDRRKLAKRLTSAVFKPRDSSWYATLSEEFGLSKEAEDQNPKQYLYQPQSESLYQDVTIPAPKTAGDEFS